jgi:hypothetical protein
MKKFQVLEAEMPRFIANHSETITAVYGKPTNLLCPPEGKPVPSLRWYKDDILLMKQYTGNLSITKAMLSDEGRYSCLSVNFFCQFIRLLVVADFSPPLKLAFRAGSVGFKLIFFRFVAQSVRFSCVKFGLPISQFSRRDQPFSNRNFLRIS